MFAYLYFCACVLFATSYSILASYHKDQIYIFDTAEGCTDEPGLERGGGARQCLGGHLNEKTFLKDVAFFGPNDDYVVSGCDSGNMWIWDATSGYVESLEPCRAHNGAAMSSSSSLIPMSSRPCDVVGVFDAGMER